MHPLAKLDHKHVWHPFTQMRDWLRQEPRIIVSGHGAVVRDAHGREYLDGNSSIEVVGIRTANEYDETYQLGNSMLEP